MNTADQTAKVGCRASTTIFLWLYWRDTPPVQSDQLCSIGADMMSATSLSLSIYNLLLYAFSSQTWAPDVMLHNGLDDKFMFRQVIIEIGSWGYVQHIM